MTDTSQANITIQRAYIFLNDREWEKASALFESAIDLAPESSAAYVGAFLSSIKCADIASVRPVIPRLRNFSLCEDTTEEKLHPLFGEICEKYYVEYFFTEEDIKELCFYGGGKSSHIARARALARSRDGFIERWENDKNLVNARRFADEEMSDMLDSLYNNVVNTYNDVIDADILRAAEKEEEFFEKQRLSEIEARYLGALDKKELFENACENAKRARDEGRYKDGVKILKDYKGHPDANELYLDCLEQYSSGYWAYGRKFAFGVLAIYALILIGCVGMTLGDFSYPGEHWFVPQVIVCIASIMCLHAQATYEKIKFGSDRIAVMSDKLLDAILHMTMPITTLVPVLSAAIYAKSWAAVFDGFLAVSPAFVYFIAYYSLTRQMSAKKAKKPLMWILIYSFTLVFIIDGIPIEFFALFAREGIYYGEFSVYQHIMVPILVNGSVLGFSYFIRKKWSDAPVFMFSVSTFIQIYVYVIQITLGLWWTVFIYLPIALGAAYGYLRLEGVDVLARFVPPDPHEEQEAEECGESSDSAEHNKPEEAVISYGFGFTDN